MTALPLSLRPRRMRPAGIVLAAVTLALATYGAAALRTTTPPTSSTSGAADGAMHDGGIPAAPGGPVLTVGDLEQIDRSIAVWTANLARESRDYIAATNLGTLYEGRARLTGDVGDYDRARQALGQALAVEPSDLTARITHARVLASLHDFPTALAEARAILRDDPTALPALATAGDAELELGDVVAAAASFQALASAAPGAAVDARLSRLAFIEGRPTEAWRLALQARAEAVADGSSGTATSWYAYVLGTLAMTDGRPADALGWFQRAAAEWPGSFLARAGVARAEAALGRIDEAIADDQRAIAIAPQPDTLAALGDLYALRDDATLANRQYDTVEAIAHLGAVNQQVFNRQIVLFSVNHDRDLAEALRLAQAEIAQRRDAYGYDALAWALLANGRAAEADAAIRQATAFGTVDPLFSYHAGLIAQALGEPDRARALLAAAIAPVGGLDPLATSRAQAALQALGVVR